MTINTKNVFKSTPNHSIVIRPSWMVSWNELSISLLPRCHRLCRPPCRFLYNPKRLRQGPQPRQYLMVFLQCNWHSLKKRRELFNKIKHVKTQKWNIPGSGSSSHCFMETATFLKATEAERFSWAVASFIWSSLRDFADSTLPIS